MMGLADSIVCVCVQTKEQMLQSWNKSCEILAALFAKDADDRELEAEKEPCLRGMKHNRSSFRVAELSLPCNMTTTKAHSETASWRSLIYLYLFLNVETDKMSTTKTEDVIHASLPDVEAPAPRSPTAIIIEPNSAQIREELQRFARSEQSAADTRYDLKVKEMMAQYNNCLTDACMA